MLVNCSCYFLFSVVVKIHKNQGFGKARLFFVEKSVENRLKTFWMFERLNKTMSLSRAYPRFLWISEAFNYPSLYASLVKNNSFYWVEGQHFLLTISLSSLLFGLKLSKYFFAFITFSRYAMYVSRSHAAGLETNIIISNYCRSKQINIVINNS